MNKRSAINKDRLSQLPQPILHNILSLLSQRDAVQTSLLSKSWRYLWHGRLNVEFRDIDYPFDKKEEIWPFIDKTLQRYLYQNLSLQKFLVDIRSVAVDFALLRKWIPVLLMNMGVRSLNLLFRMNNIAFPLPLVVFQSESLVELHLQRCDLSILESTDNVMLNNLQTLRLHDVYITDEIFEKIISGCPLMENMDLLECIGLKSIKLHKHYNIITLRTLRIENCCDNWFLRHKNMHFPHLKSLKKATEGFFFDTPNILYFEYSCDGDAVLPSIKFTTTSNVWKSKISLSYKLDRLDKDFLKLNTLLKALSQSHITLELVYNEYQKLHIDDSYGGFYKPVVVEHLKLRGFFSSSFDPVIPNCFFRICRPLYIHMDLYGDVHAKCIVVEYISKLILDEAGPDLEKVSIEVWDEKAEEWHFVKGTSFPALRFKQLIRFLLTWKERDKN
ncbi:hypothetical protein CASFOL_021908 [Castilleja foliolosa]|uniref:F-box domain-containing protein n=1 Tax=Castilleja foliolosa TaxID=1961234 RepID=A0ABD3D0L3_9LAMI